MRRPPLARHLMRRPVRQLTAWTPVRDAAAFLLRQGISGAPVVDRHGRWVGVFTENDLARYLQNRIAPRHPERTLESRESVADLSRLSVDRLGDTLVQEFMTSGLYTVFPEATLGEVVRTMTAFKIHRVFVIGEKEAELLGVITTMDILRWMNGERRLGPRGKKLQRA